MIGARTALGIAPVRTVWQAAGDYVVLTKPRIVVLLLVTAYAAMVIAARGPVPAPLVLWTLLGGSLAAGSANAINNVLDRDVDAVMARTRGRPVPAGRVAPHHALQFGIALGVASVAVLAAFANVLAAALALLAILYYVGIYTVWLKRTTPLNIVIGGGAGAIPPLVGWAAVTGGLDLTAAMLFLIIFLWTPPHFWALALHKKGDYAAARIPMLPVIRGEAETRRQIFWYTLVLVAATLAMVPLRMMGTLYLVAALALGGGFVWVAARLLRERSHRAAMRTFTYSITYLALLFAAMALDRIR